MKIIFTRALLLHFTFSYSQWAMVQQLPSPGIFSLYRKDSILYVGGKNIIYFSSDKGQTRDSTNFIPQLASLDNIIRIKINCMPNLWIRCLQNCEGGLTRQSNNASQIADPSVTRQGRLSQF